MGLPGGSDGKESACSAEDPGSVLGWEDPLEGGMAAHSSILTCNARNRWGLAGHSPWGLKELDLTEQLTLSLSHR